MWLDCTIWRQFRARGDDMPLRMQRIRVGVGEKRGKCPWYARWMAKAGMAWTAAGTADYAGVDYVLVGSSFRTWGVSLVRRPLRVREPSIVRGCPATVENRRPKSRTNSHQLDWLRCNRSRTDGVSCGVTPLFPGTTCRAVQSSSSRYSQVDIGRKPLSLQRLTPR